MGLDHVKASLCRWQPGNPVHPNHPTPTRREGQRMEEAGCRQVFSIFSSFCFPSFFKRP
jgi:hypothetical protein